MANEWEQQCSFARAQGAFLSICRHLMSQLLLLLRFSEGLLYLIVKLESYGMAMVH